MAQRVKIFAAKHDDPSLIPGLNGESREPGFCKLSSEIDRQDTHTHAHTNMHTQMQACTHTMYKKPRALKKLEIHLCKQRYCDLTSIWIFVGKAKPLPSLS